MGTQRAEGAPSRSLVDARWERLLVGAAALVCLLFVAGLRDLRFSARMPSLPEAPALPAEAGDRDATLRVRAVSEEGGPVADGLVAVYAIVDGVALRAGRGRTGPDGSAVIEGLPRGEVWVLVHGPAHARTSSRLVLESGERELTVTLREAHFFEVVAVDPMQRPIRGVRVRLFGADPLPHQAYTDETGLARLTHLGPPPYAAELTATGYDTKLLPRLELEDSPVFVKLERLSTLVVTVVEAPSAGDGGGASAAVPAVGATVTVAGSSLWPARTATTGDDGRVTIAGLPRGFYDLKAQRGDRVSDTELGVLLDRGEDEEVTLALLPGRYVTVTVTDGEGADAPPIAKADVALVEGGVSSFPLYGRTDEKGKVSLGPIAGSDATVSARAAGFVGRSAVAVEEGEDAVQVSLLRGGTIVGRVVDERGFPVDGATLEVVGIDLDGMPVAESSTITEFRDDHFAFALPGAVPLVPAGELGVMPIVPDIPSEIGPLVVSRTQSTAEPWVSGADGTFELIPVPPGRVHLVVGHPDFVETITETVRLESGQEKEIEVVLRRGGMLEGRVREGDLSPVAGARIEIAALEGTVERITYAADDGTFALAAVPAKVVLSVARPDAPETVVFRKILSVPPEERTEEEILLPERRETVVVRVTDDRGYSLDRVEVLAMSLVPDEPLRKTLFTDDEGEATLHDARGLPLRIILRRPGQAPVVAQIEAAPRRVELAMAAGLSARGEVRDRHGPLAGAAVTLYTPTGVRRARTDDDGEYLVENLAPTRVRLLVHKAEYVPMEQLARIEPTAADRPYDLGRIELELGGIVEGQVLDVREEPLAGARVAVGRVPTYLPLGTLPLGISATDRSGRFVLRDLAPGTVDIEAYRVGVGRASAAGIVVRAGDTTRGVRIVMEEDEESDPASRGGGSLAVTLAERLVGGKAVVECEHVPAGGEAERAGIEPGDRILAVNGAAVRSVGQARRRLNGPLAQDLVLELAREPDLRWAVRVRRERLRR
ncbi:MAG: carboxypeptidase regulatory-like domain-containing protein [Deltaproteobacteria bacterium]|jgi:protocatechuate 3,4-dioxygenase beta subunit|nr:carboxypeptidase regulatory-like domain-containing protein [Deltaproteobacteria bacterium]MBW2530180.1 carboxypeptidase regulatory-like domain-containing protein [Deltaproteobacteria bacterium]